MNISHFGARPNDWILKVARARGAEITARAEKRATEEYLFVSNNDESLKRLIFPISGADGVTWHTKGAR